MTRWMDMFSLYELGCVLLPCLIYQTAFVQKGKKSGKVVPKSYLVWVWIFLFYLWMAFDVTGVGTLGDILRYVKIGENPVIGGYNFVPFDSLGIGFVLNIIMCMPLGFLLPFIWKEFRKCKRTVLMGAAFSLLIEFTQIFNFRATDVDDLLTNTCGTLAGYLIWKAFSKISGDRFRCASEGTYEAVKYILLAIAGVFFLYNPFLFLRG